MSTEGYIHYIVIRRDLSFGEYTAQLAHAGEAYYMLATDHVMFGQKLPFEYNKVTVIVKGIRNEQRLRTLEDQLKEAKVQHVAIVESEEPPDLGRETKRRSLNGQMTCISLMPGLREDVERHVRHIHTIESLDPNLELTLFDAIAHGDDKHRAWLKEAIRAHFAGEKVIRP